MTEEPREPTPEPEEARDPAELWEPELPDEPVGPEGVPKEEDPGPDA